MDSLESKNPWLFPALVGVLVLALAYGGYSYYALHQLHATTVAAYDAKVALLSAALGEASSTNADLLASLDAEQERNDDLASEVKDISSTVKTLDKLAQTDPQLLAKYSKVYFLNENYVPKSLSDIDGDELFDSSRDLQILTEVRPHLEDMINDAADDDVTIQIASAYRSFATQAALKSGYRVTYGSGANTFSAEQGYSEHQLGTAVDFTTPAIGGGLTGFETTDAYDWLADNAYKYGFILSYPPNNGYYIYEPWHWRFVGEKLADYLHDHHAHFYDLDQRTINTYLVNFYDK